MIKKAGWISAAAGFLSAFTAMLLTAPQNGKKTRGQIAGAWGRIVNAPSKLNAACRGRRQKAYEFGRGHCEQLNEERLALKNEAHQEAVKSEKEL
ncbi:hypothetical protein [Salibacterium halotolerans]|uniref:YtxH-like protein n=1 Tax=Salibacterium halotolerans TaxID=1884432 RepID=A0A1I5T4G1_9BACI|nr:hypothetical protein [Salibacterium halotolerans]SFP77903.1 hypothetical protein SAMN05518683_11010 [Salibacterium halotolerans]